MTVKSTAKDRAAVATMALCALWLVAVGFAFEAADDVARGSLADLPVLAAWVLAVSLTRLAVWPVWVARFDRIMDAREVAR